MFCPFCDLPLPDSKPELHILACSLCEMAKNGPKRKLAEKCELAYRKSQNTEQDLGLVGSSNVSYEWLLRQT